MSEPSARIPSPSFIFGYGSLMWRPGFRFRTKQPGVARDHARRFWQGSTDHRGTPEAPGRVVTLAAAPGSRCVGVLYEIEPRELTQIVALLDHREQGGYVRRELAVTRLPEHTEILALTYVALPGNPNYLGPAQAEVIAAQVKRSHGPSGSNREYVEKLATTLLELGADDPHVSEIDRLLAGGG